MGERRPISTAPMDGSKVTVVWIDFDGRENESPARYRSLRRLQAAGGDWDQSDEGWWVSIDSSTQKRVEPTAWTADSDDEEGD